MQAPAQAPADNAAREELKALLSDRHWRLNHLYTIQNKDAEEVTFTMNEVQEELDESLHNRNIVPKSRQHGITTYACMRALDTALFRENAKCGLVFHKKTEAVKAFGEKIMYAYDRLPAWLRAEVGVVKRDMSGEVEFTNGSKIICSTSHRGGTLQFLHVSEYGPMVTMFPQRAAEVASGALNAITKDGIAIIESTAMGAWGDFYERCNRAIVHERQVEAGTAARTLLDYKPFFFAWWRDTNNWIDPTGVNITQDQHKYFDTVEAKEQCRIFAGQRAWYVKKAEEQKDAMLREHPSTFEECFKGSVEGAYYANEMAAIEREGRICDLPFIPTLPVYTFWDIGRDDATAIWVMQVVGPWYHFLRYYEANHTSAAHYGHVLAKWRDEFGYRYARHYLPHDAGVSDWSRTDNKTRKEVVEDMKIGPVEVVDRIQALADGIEQTRQMLARCKFDKVNCGENPVGSGRGGLPSMRAYRKQYDEKSQTWSETPIKSWANHGADALRQCAQGFDKPPEQPDATAERKKRERRRELTRGTRSGMAV